MVGEIIAVIIGIIIVVWGWLYIKSKSSRNYY